MEQHVFEGTWEEVTGHAAELAGKRERVTVLGEAAAPAGTRPIWETASEVMSDVPDGELDSLSADGSTQVDHDIYGTPKRPV
jgi:hypothetical protein